MPDVAFMALKVLFQMPVIGIVELSNRIQKSYNATHNLIKIFVELGFLVENADQKRNKLYRLEPYLKLLEKEY